MTIRSSLALGLLLLSACSRPQTASPENAPPSAVHVAPTPPSSVAPAATASAAPPAPEPVASAPSPTPVASASAAAPAAAAPTDAPVPTVKVVNIGMHIGGGPNDDGTKEPIKKSVEPHFDEFRRCWGALGDPAAKGDFGLDLHIPRDGGKATVDHPRTALKGKPFTECVVKVFEGIDFRKPKTGTTTVSYSLRFGG